MDSSALPPGTRLGEFEILRVVAIGGFGIVYMARDHSLDRDVALKEFMPARLVGRNDGERVTVRSAAAAETFAVGLKSFVNEARLLARFSHPAMVKVYRFWEANGTAYMAMPFLRGPTLKDVRRSLSGPPTEAWLRSVIEPLLDALAMLHAEGVYHRDIAPDNVLLVDAGAPVLLDFGAARHLIGDGTESPTAVLKPNYAPIEQYAESKRLRQGPWTDLYALGALVTYLLDGSPPQASTARAIHDERERLAKRCIPNVSAAFLAAIDWTLAVRPQDRPQSVAALRRALTSRGTASANDRRPRSAPSGARAPATAAIDSLRTTLQRARSAPRRPVGVRPLLTAALLLLTVAVTAALWWRAPPDAPAPQAIAWAEPTVDPPAAPAPSAVASIPVAALPVAASSSALLSYESVAPSTVPSTVPSSVLSTMPSAVPSAERPAIQRRAPDVVRTSAAKTSARASYPERRKSERRAAPARLAAPAHLAAPGPIELCAAHNFFLRPFCVRRRCDEQRFRAYPECVQARQADARRLTGLAPQLRERSHTGDAS